MNKHELNGGARYVGGRVEKTVGDVIESRDWQVDGVIDQAAGGAENLYGRAQSIAKDALDTAPGLAAEARAKAEDAAERGVAAARRGGRAAMDAAGEQPLLWALAAALGGYAVAWLVHGRRD